MPRTARIVPGGLVFHVLNRGNARARIFGKEADYAAFERVMKETSAKRPMRILGCLIMPNHWHLVLWPEHDGDLAAFMQRLTVTRVRRWRLHRKTVGCGHLYASVTASSRNDCLLASRNRRDFDRIPGLAVEYWT
jgi:putative transposase